MTTNNTNDETIDDTTSDDSTGSSADIGASGGRGLSAAEVREAEQAKARAKARAEARAKARARARAKAKARAADGPSAGEAARHRAARRQDDPAFVPHWWDGGAQHAVKAAKKTRTVRGTILSVKRIKRGLWRWSILLFGCQVVVYVFGYGTHPGGPLEQFGPPSAVGCGTGSASAVSSVEGQSVVVVMARAQGQALRRLAGPPPDPATTQAVAKGAADAVVVSLLALQASVQDKPEPAKVVAYNAVARQHHADQVARNVAACACPTTPGTDGGGTDGGGVSSVSNRAGAGAGVARRVAAAAGFTGADLDIAVAIAGAESSYRPNVTNRNRDGSTDYGMWQINSVHADLLTGANWADPATNARMAYAVWSAAGRSFSPWTTYDSGAYRAYLPGATGGGARTAGNVTAQTFSNVSGCGGTATTASYGKGPGAWGGYTNGRIPAGALCHPAFSAAVLVRCDAATSLNRLNAAYRGRFGTNIAVTDSYRDFPAQVRVKASKGNLAAKPGTSNHGWGLALDLGGGVQKFNAPQHAWLAANGPAAGWVNPSWARATGSKPEPWHFEYTSTSRGNV